MAGRLLPAITTSPLASFACWKRRGETPAMRGKLLIPISPIPDVKPSVVRLAFWSIWDMSANGTNSYGCRETGQPDRPDMSGFVQPRQASQRRTGQDTTL